MPVGYYQHSAGILKGYENPLNKQFYYNPFLWFCQVIFTQMYHCISEKHRKTL